MPAGGWEAARGAHDGLAVGRVERGADLELHDPGVVEAADGALGAAEEFGGPAAQFGFWGMQVHGGRGVLGLQVQQAAGMRAQGEVGGVHQPDRAGGRADPDNQVGGGRATGVPGYERHLRKGGRPAPGAAHHLVCLQHLAAAVRTRGAAPGSRRVTRPGSPVRTCAPWLCARATRRAISGSVSR